MAVTRVAVIGAGASGLAAIKCCLDEGLDVVCFERTDSIGGLWHYTEEVRDRQACVMKSTVINTSKEVTCFSDFPVPQEYANFMHNTSLMKYFHSYADHFNLQSRIRFNTEVNRVSPSKDFAESGEWHVTWYDKKAGEKTDEVFTAVLICTGHHASPYRAELPGLSEFRGQVIHSKEYKHAADYENKKVVIVGIGNSAIDTAVELSRVASNVFLSTRRGTWLFSKTSDKGLPSDLRFSRAAIWFAAQFPNLTKRIIVGTLNSHMDHKLYALEPQHGPFQQHPAVSEELPSRILAGCVTIKPNVKRLTETGVEFEDGTFEDNIDVVVLATGYIFGFPFLDMEVLEVKNNQVDLYKHMFPPRLSRPTLAVIGCVQPLGSVIPISEMQSRLATRVFKDLIKLPPRDVMEAEVNGYHRQLRARYVNTQRHTIQVDLIPYLDQLATIIGCRPNFRTLAVTDPRLMLSCYFGPFTSIQYRLTGPGCWGGARDAILGTWDRVYYPLKTRTITHTTVESTTRWHFVVALLCAVIVAYLMFV